MGMMGSVLREGGWSESDISEMVSGSGSVLLDNEEVLDALVSKAERFSDSLRKSGWSSEEVKDALGLDLRPEKKGGRPPKKVVDSWQWDEREESWTFKLTPRSNLYNEFGERLYG